MKKWLLATVFCVASGAAHAACEPSNATAGMIGCWPQVGTMSNTDSVDIWQPGPFPASANRIHKLDLLHIAPPFGDVTPNEVHATTLSASGQTTFGSVQWIYASLPAFPAAADTALASAITQCSLLGTTLVVPQGIYVLNGSHTASVLNNCSIVGSGIPGIGFGVTAPGTFFEMTSNSVPPFILGSHFSITGVNFFWPTQTGSTVYPPLFSDNGGEVSYGLFNNISIINAYDAFKQISGAWGAVKITDSTIYAVHSAFTLSNTPNEIAIHSVNFLPSIWLSFGGSTAAVGHAAQNSKIFDIQSGTVAINFDDNVVVGWKYGIYLESGGNWAESRVTATTWDTVGTIIDSSAGGTYSSGNIFNGNNASCALSGSVWGAGPNGGNLPCFNMGDSGELILDGFYSGGSQGDFVTTAGANIILTNSESLNIGGNTLTDGLDYYQLRITGSNSPEIRVQNNRFGGINGNAKIHGITTTGGGTPSIMLIQGNSFLYHNDEVNVRPPIVANIAGNTSFTTHAAGGLISFNQIGTNAIVYYGNSWSSNPAPVVSSCGTGATVAAGSGPNGGFVTTGTGTVNTCDITMPLSLYGKCVFMPGSAVTIGAGPTGVPNDWTLSFYVGASIQSSPSMNVFYSCPGQQ